VAIPDPEDPTEPADPIEPQAQPASLRALRAIARKSGLSLEQAFAWAEDGLTEAEARSRAFEDWSSRSRLLGLAPYVEERGPDPIDKFQRWALAAFHRRLRLKLDDDAPKDAPQHLSLIDAARELVRMRTGRDQRFVTPNQFLHSRDFAHSTSFFAELLENTARKTLRNGYEMEPTTYQRWTARRDLADFKAVSEVNLGAAKNYTETPELMPIQEQTITDAKEVYTLATYGNRFSISRQAILNDDLAGFARLPRMFGSAAARTINHLVYTHLNANPTMTEDGKALFADDHPSGDNLRPAAAPSVAELGEMRQLMRLQGDLTDPANKLNLTPRFIIAPANYEVECEQALNAVFTFAPTSAANATPLSFRSLELIVESYLDGLSATRWYVVADPNRVECVVVGRLTGQEEPVIQQIVDTEILGVAWVAYFDCVVRAIDHRGLVRNG
jgi:phage major head subunit gpT-like protein